MKLIRLFLLSLILLAPAFLYAASDMTLTASPESPAPFEQVTLTLTSYSFDVNTASIIWKIGSKVFSSGIGQKKINVTTGAIGVITPIIAQATLDDGEVVQASLNLTPQSVDILWETPESYVPPFYEGKSLPGVGAAVRVTALPNMSLKGVQVPAQNLSYSWYINDELVDSASGYNKQTATIPLDYLSSKTDIKVLARSASGAAATKTISVYPHDILPLLYVYDDTLGIDMGNLIDRRFETTNDFTLSLVPFYLSAKNSLASSPTYIWLLDGLPVTPQEGTLMSFHPGINDSGTKNLSIIIGDTRRTLQKAESDLQILFDTHK